MGLLTAGYHSLFAKFNKSRGKFDDQKEGVIEDLGELTLDKDDEELLKLKTTWENLYSNSETKARIHNAGDINQRYWMGRQFPDTDYENDKRPLVDNIIFEGLETMLPLATQQNPEPIVLTDKTPEMKALGDKVKRGLEYLADINHLKTKLKKGVRHWSLRFVGVWEIGFDAEVNEIVVGAANPKDLILDPTAPIEDGEYKGEFLGIRKQDTGSNLLIRFPEKAEDIRKQCADKMGSLVAYRQWWTNEIVFYTLNNIVLHKSKNPHFNYPQETTTVDEFGKPIQKTIPGLNHFARPKVPFVFLTVFDLGDEPCDKTNLVQQGLTTQDNINKRLKQIDRNADNLNGGIAVDSTFFSKEQGAQIAEAKRQGRTIMTPGDPNKIIKVLEQPALPPVLFEALNDARQRFMSRFGAAGSTAQGTEQETTVRGKIIAGNNDSSRTGGGVSEYLEVAASRIFDYWVQMMYVYYDTTHNISVMGANNAQEMITLEASEFQMLGEERKLVIKTQTGSMIPKDELSEYNSALTLWENGALDPISLFERLDDTNPQERAMKLMIFKTNPVQYMQQFLSVAPPQPVMAIPQGGGGSEAGQPPVAVGAPEQAPQPQSEVQQKSSELLNSVKI